MAKNSIRDYSATNSSNTDIQSIDISEGCSPAGINNAIREVMADLKDVSTGAVALESPAMDSLTVDTTGIVYSGGNVGIGTSSPSSFYSLADNLVVGTGSGGNGITIYSGSADSGFIGFNDTASASMQGFIQYNHSGDYMAFAPNGSEKMRIDSSGNLLVGTPIEGPAGLSIANGNNLSWSEGAGQSFATIFRQSSSGATVIANGYQQTNTANGFASSYSTSWAKTAVALSYGTIRFYTDSAVTTAAGTDVTPTERMRIDSSGNLLVGTTTNSDYSASLKFYSVSTTYAGAFKTTGGAAYSSLGVWNTASSGTIYLVSFLTGVGGSVGSITSNGSTTSYNTSSDYRLKENVTADWDATTRLKQLNPVRFNFIADADTTVDGFLAHEVQTVVPEAISGTKDGMRDEEYEVTPAVLDEDGNEVTPAVMGTRSVPDYQGIDQSKLVPLLVKTIQELEARITALEAN